VKKPQWITVGVALVLTIALYAATNNQIFGTQQKPLAQTASASPEAAISVDSILFHAKEGLTADQRTRLSFLENSITRGDVAEQKMHLYHQLARFWYDTARIFEPYAWYTSEAARLENSEKSLTFAAHLFLDNLKVEENPELKRWKALQAEDLFNRSLKINSANDSSQVGLGEVYLYGGIGEGPMQGIMKIRGVAEKDSTNVYAQITLGHASVASGQFDKAIDRFLTVLRLQPQNLEAILSLAEAYEQKGDKATAITWYKKSVPLINVAGLRKEVESRIVELSK
jgi:tetratricopeptide (TPR) repeat protein